MKRDGLCLLLAICLASSTGAGQISGQITLGGATEVHALKSASTESPRAVNSGRPSFGWRTDMFLTASVSDKVGAVSDVRVMDNQYVSFDYLAIRMVDLTPIGLNLQAGKFDIPFGNLGQRRFPRRNPLFGLPLMYEYSTSLPEHSTTEEDVLAGRGKGHGMRLLDGGMYNLGAMVDGSVGFLDYALALTSGTVSATSSYGYANFNSDPGKIVRMAVTPETGLTIGASYAWGGYLDDSAPVYGRKVDAGDYEQKAIDLDMEFSRGHLVLDGEGVYSAWRVPLETRDAVFKAFGYYLEGKYTIVPRLYGAFRVSGLHFGDAPLGQGEQRWDYDTTEWEGGIGFFVEKDVLLKIVRRETRISGGTRPKDNLTVMQLVVAY
jgi:hypothetical protein